MKEKKFYAYKTGEIKSNVLSEFLKKVKKSKKICVDTFPAISPKTLVRFMNGHKGKIEYIIIVRRR